MNIKDKPPYVFEASGMFKWLLRVFYGICVFLLAIDFFIHRHIETSVESLPAFYAIYGFVACAVLVLVASQLRKMLMRDKNYYDTELADSTNTAINSLDDGAENKNKNIGDKE